MRPTRPGTAGESTVVLTEEDLIPFAFDGTAPPEDGGRELSTDEDPTVVRPPPAPSTAISGDDAPDQVLLAEYVLIQMDDDGSTRLEDVARALSEVALSRPPRAAVRARGPSTLRMRTFNVKVWMHAGGYQVLEAQDDKERSCSLIARRG